MLKSNLVLDKLRSSPVGTTAIAHLEVLQLSLKLFDSTMCHLQVFVQAITLSDQLKLKSANSNTK